jgi:hypothetical protein
MERKRGSRERIEKGRRGISGRDEEKLRGIGEE